MSSIYCIFTRQDCLFSSLLQNIKTVTTKIYEINCIIDGFSIYPTNICRASPINSPLGIRAGAIP